MEFLHKQWSKKKFNSLSKQKRFLVIAYHIREAEINLSGKINLLAALEAFDKASLYLDYLEINLPASLQSLLTEINKGITDSTIDFKNKFTIIRRLNDCYFQLLKLAGRTISDYEFFIHTRDNPSRALKSDLWPIYIILDNLRSPFNIGSIFRTADAVRITELILCGFSVCPPNKKLERASMGATGYVSWKYFDKTEDALLYLKRKHIPIIGLDTIPQSTLYFDFQFPKPIALVIGNEELGISSEILDQCDHYLQIPQYGYKNSINVSSATSVVLYEILRQYLSE